MVASSIPDIDSFFLVFGGMMVFFMHAGFGMLQVGGVQQKDSRKHMLKNVIDLSISSICWWLIGFGIAYGVDDHEFAGNSNYATRGIENFGEWFVSWGYCSIAFAIGSGSVAERITFRSYVIMAFVFCTFLYPFLVHWAWGDGWASSYRSNIQQELLGRCGVLDFSGSSVVHMSGGLMSLVMTKMIGARADRFSKTGLKYPPYNTVFQCLGTLLLWFAWYGYNIVSARAITGMGDVVARVAATTTIAASTSCLTSIAIGFVRYGYTSSSLANGGALSGLVAISAGCATTTMEGALVIGFISGGLYFVSSDVVASLEIDDMTDAIPIHFVNGAWGIIAAGLFTTGEYYKQVYFHYYNDGTSRIDNCMGALYGGSGWQLGANLCFLFAVLAWIGCMSFIMFFLVDLVIGVRLLETEANITAGESKNMTQTGTRKEQQAKKKQETVDAFKEMVSEENL